MLRKEFLRFAALAGGYFATSRETGGKSLSMLNSNGEISASELQQFLVSLTLLKPCS